MITVSSIELFSDGEMIAELNGCGPTGHTPHWRTPVNGNIYHLVLVEDLGEIKLLDSALDFGFDGTLTFRGRKYDEVFVVVTR